MTSFIISEHHGRRPKQKWFIEAPGPEEALRLSTASPFKPLVHAHDWPFIDDQLGGGALIDPFDENHCIRADPRSKDFIKDIP